MKWLEEEALFDVIMTVRNKRVGSFLILLKWDFEDNKPKIEPKMILIRFVKMKIILEYVLKKYTQTHIFICRLAIIGNLFLQWIVTDMHNN